MSHTSRIFRLFCNTVVFFVVGDMFCALVIVLGLQSKANATAAIQFVHTRPTAGVEEQCQHLCYTSTEAWKIKCAMRTRVCNACPECSRSSLLYTLFSKRMHVNARKNLQYMSSTPMHVPVNSLTKRTPTKTRNSVSNAISDA